MQRLRHLLVWLDYMTSQDTDLHPGDPRPLTYYST